MINSIYQSVFDIIKDIETFENQTYIAKIRQLTKKIKIEKLAKKKKNEYSNNFNKRFKNKIKKRDNECQICGKNKDLVIHHITYIKKNTDENSCITLCRGCNVRVNKNKEYWHSYFKTLIHYKISTEQEE